MLLLDLPGRFAAGLITLIAGIAGVTCSGRIYMVRARPAWFSGYTLGEFFSTALLLGPFFVLTVNTDAPAWVRMAAVAGGTCQLGVQLLKLLWLSRSETFELRGTSVLLAGQLRNRFLLRLALLVLAGIVLPWTAPTGWPVATAVLLALGGEWLGRYLFFVSVVPKNIAAAFTSRERIAA